MDEGLQVEAARIPDRDRLLNELRESGLDARPVDEVGIQVSSGDDDEVFAHVERMIMSIGAVRAPQARRRDLHQAADRLRSAGRSRAVTRCRRRLGSPSTNARQRRRPTEYVCT